MGKKEIIYECAWKVLKKGQEPTIVRNGHHSLGTAQMEAIKQSELWGHAMCAMIERNLVGEVEDETVLKKYGYINGQEVDMEIDQTAAIDVARKEAYKKQNATEKENKMTNIEPGTNGNGKKAPAKAPSKAPAKPSKATAKAPSKAKSTKAGTTLAGNGKKAPAKAPAKAEKAVSKAPRKAASAPVGAPGTILAALELRAGTSRAKLAAFLCDSKGKMLALKDAEKAVFGKSDDTTGLNPTITHIAHLLRKNKIEWHIERSKDEGKPMIGLKSGKQE